METIININFSEIHISSKFINTRIFFMLYLMMFFFIAVTIKGRSLAIKTILSFI